MIRLFRLQILYIQIETVLYFPQISTTLMMPSANKLSFYFISLLMLSRYFSLEICAKGLYFSLETLFTFTSSKSTTEIAGLYVKFAQI